MFCSLFFSKKISFVRVKKQQNTQMPQKQEELCLRKPVCVLRLLQHGVQGTP